MGIILSIETATQLCSVALHEDGDLLDTQELLEDRSHSEYLAVMIKNLLHNAGKSVNDLSAVAVSKGPGSYTGLRIGVSTAKGLCFGLKVPLISVNSLLSMAYEVQTQNLNKYDLCPMLDARRMEVYCLITDPNLKVKQKTKAVIIDESSFERELRKGGILFFGNGMAKCRKILGRHKNACFIDEVYPKASNIGYLAYKKYKKEEFENTETFEPFYLKDFIATVPKKLI
jgi:tRNA threonylcarbamoyladenosine biosynthesis protein TsaB